MGIEKTLNLDFHSNVNADSNITKTGYRSVFLLMNLMEGPKTRAELLECFAKDPIINKDLSKDTITITVNTLRAAGCIISRPTQRTDNKYVFKSHPFLINLSRENIEALQTLREGIVTLHDWEMLIALNNLYAKFAEFAPDEESKNILLYNHPLSDINHGILRELMIFASIKKYTNIVYDSPENGEENLDFVPETIVFENEKLYAWGYCDKYKEMAYLRVDKIYRVNAVTFLGSKKEITELEIPATYVEYELKGYSALMYSENKSEVILSEDKKSEYSIKIGAKVTNKFNFTQRILYYGTDCRIIKPDSMRKEILDTLRKIKADYENER